MAIDTQNRFKGFLGATELGFDLGQFLIRTFASKEQQKKLKKRVPPAYNNLFIDSENRFVACSAADVNQIRVINSVGKNIYKPGFYGEAQSLDENNRLVMPSFVDLTVDKNGIISLIEQRSGKIYQYDGNGNILTVFAGKGRNKGYFTLACSIGSDSAGNLYVLDQTRCNIQKFEPTDFIKKVHAASVSFQKGKYDAAFTQWEEIVRMNADYPLARRQLGALYYKQEKSREAMGQYLVADDMAGYSEAYSLYRHNVFKKQFGLIVLSAVAILAALIAGIYYLKKYSDRLRLKAYALRGVKNYKS
jgi:tetratricopeptide (TPR) repeat protein